VKRYSLKVYSGKTDIGQSTMYNLWMRKSLCINRPYAAIMQSMTMTLQTSK